jgi:ABC-type transport system involved in multi-copper enzyme maturation permease subunit
MVTTSTHPARLAGGASLPAAAGRAGFGGALRSEFTKIRSVRSTYWTLLALVLACIGIGALFSWGDTQHVASLAGTRAHAAAAANARDHAVATSLFGLLIGQLVIIVLGALTITSEYSTGMIRTSLTTMPRRGTVFAAKAIVFGTVALVTGLITSFGSLFAGQAILSTQHAGASIGQPGVLRAVIGGGLFLTVCGLLSFGIGAVLRHTAGAITASIGLLFVLYILSGFLPGNWAVHVDKWIPFNAGGAIWEQLSGQDMFRPWAGFAVFCGYAAIAILSGLVLFRRRDA